MVGVAVAVVPAVEPLVVVAPLVAAAVEAVLLVERR